MVSWYLQSLVHPHSLEGPAGEQTVPEKALPPLPGPPSGLLGTSLRPGSLQPPLASPPVLRQGTSPKHPRAQDSVGKTRSCGPVLRDPLGLSGSGVLLHFLGSPAPL